MNDSPLSLVAHQPEAVRKAWLESLDAKQLRQYAFDWRFRARSNQLPPEDDDWTFWMILAGRGFGKTRTAAEWVRSNVRRYGRWLLVGRTAADVRDTMIEGESGLLHIGQPEERPTYEPSKRKLTWPNGAIGILRESAEPEALRGQQCEAFWADELAAWIYPQETWDMLMFGYRLGNQPRGVISTTPRPIPLVQELVKDPACRVTRGSTYDNVANLAPAFIKTVIARYEGTRLGRQELMAEILDDIPGALWQRSQIDRLRVGEAPALQRVVVAIDPAATSSEDADATGIVVAGLGIDGQGYVLDDISMEQATPHTWGSAAVEAYRRHQADRIVAETNNGGEMVEFVVRTIDRSVAFKAVHASRGKLTRAEPVAALYEQGKVHHVGPAGQFSKLEDEMCTWVPGMDSPDRMDALVWALTELMVNSEPMSLALPEFEVFERQSPWRM